MSDLSTLPKGDSAWLLRKAIERIIQQVSVLETNIGSSTTGNSANTQIIFNDNGTLRGDTGLVFNKTTDALTVAGLVTAGSATITGDLTVDTSTLKVDSTNDRVGIGTATPAYPLQVVGNAVFNADATCKRFFVNDTTGTANAYINSANGSTSNIFFGGQTNYNNGAIIYDDASNFLAFRTNGTERARIDSSGNVGVGVVPTAQVSSYKSFQFGIGGNLIGRSDNAGIELSSNSYRNTSGNYIYLNTDFAASYRQYSGQHEWFNAPSGTAANAITFTQAMTLDANGRLLIGKTASALGTVGLEEAAGGYIQATVTSDASLFCNRLATDGETIKFYRQTVQVGNISVTTLATTYNTISDYRLKESVKPLVGGLARVNALKPSVYNWKSNGSAGEGFLAHELADIVPAAVTGEKDAVSEDGSIKPQGVDMSRVVPILVAAIQELTARVQTLEAR